MINKGHKTKIHKSNHLLKRYGWKLIIVFHLTYVLELRRLLRITKLNKIIIYFNQQV